MALLLFCSSAWRGGGVSLRTPLLPRRGEELVMSAPLPSPTSANEEALLRLLRTSETRGSSLSTADKAEVERLARELEGGGGGGEDTNLSPLLGGRWRVLFQGKPGEDVSPTSLESWKRYFAGEGPSPVQNLVSGAGSVNRLYQILQIEGSSGEFVNVIDLSPRLLIAINARLEGRPQPNRLEFRFTGGTILVPLLWGGSLPLPYPVPFALLGDNAKGWLQTDYLSESIRLSRGNKGSLFVLTPEPEEDSTSLSALLCPPSPPPPSATLDKGPVLICPAQFGTGDDYEDLVKELESRGHPTRVVGLRRTDWFKLIPAALTTDYWQCTLKPEKALGFYFEALDEALQQLRQEFPQRRVGLVAHSIGGWVVRAWLGQLSGREREAVSSVVTLGTPHAPPPSGTPKQLDQTRGLLSDITSRFPGAYHKELRYLSVGSSKAEGKLWGGGGEGLLAYASYLALSGRGNEGGDGITPLGDALLDGSEHREVDAYHIAFVPFLGLRLLGTQWYGSAQVVGEWCDFLE